MDSSEVRKFRNILNDYFSTYNDPPVLSGINRVNPRIIKVYLANVPIDNGHLNVLRDKVKKDLGDRTDIKLIKGKVELWWYRTGLFTVISRILLGILFLFMIFFCAYNIYVTLPLVKSFVFTHENPVQHYMNSLLYILYTKIFTSTG